jgi:putative phosphonate metabolism protein
MPDERATSAPRFAIYFVPAADTELYRFGAAVLGYDCYTGQDLAHPPGIGFSPSEWSALTAEPRTYGFHATLKAPFRLRPQLHFLDLREQVHSLAAELEPLVIDPVVGLVAGFVAIVERSPSRALSDLAARCVMTLDCFRDALTLEERNKRIASGLDAPQIANLDRYGYPYVLDQFRFHLTLTGALAPEQRERVHGALADAFTRLPAGPIRIDRIALCHQAYPSACFQVIDSVPLGARS